MDRNIMLFAAGSIVFILGIAYAAYWTEQRQEEMIASGQCRAVQEALYQPPPTMICASYNTQGACTTWVPVQDDPYMRTHWECTNGEDFWRRSE